MCEAAPSTSTQDDVSPELIKELLEEFAKELKSEETSKARVQATQRKLKNLKYKYRPLRDEYYRVLRRMEDTQRKPYILCEIGSFLGSDKSLWGTQNVKLFGFYTYDSDSSSHYLLSCHRVRTDVVNKAKVLLDMYKVEKFPVVDTHVEVFGDVKVSRGVYTVIVDFFHEIREDYVSENS